MSRMASFVGNVLQKKRHVISLSPAEDRLFELLRDVVRQDGLSTTVRVAGGWVRDKLLGLESHDIDVALDNSMGLAFAQRVNAHLKRIGEPTHTIGVIQSNPEQSKHLETATLKVHDHWVDFVNLRSEAYVDDGSRIPQVSYGTPQQDAERRDFTVNALFYNVNRGEVEDFTGRGLSDLEQGVLRTPLPATVTFHDDPLRMLRAVRFASRFGFSLDPGLREGLEDAGNAAALATKVSRERVGTEVHSMLTGPDPVSSLRTIYEHGLGSVVFRLPADVAASVAATDGEPARRAAASRCVTRLQWALRVLPAVSSSGADGGGAVPELTKPAARCGAYLAAVLYPFAAEPHENKKGRAEPTATHVVQSELKLRKVLADEVAAIARGASELRAAVAAEASSAKGDASVSVDERRLAVGRLLCDIKECWHAALYLAAAADAADADGASDGSVVASVAMLEGISKRYAEFYARVADAWALERVWAKPPLLNGKKLMGALGLKRGGPLIGELMRHQIDWMIVHPDGIADDCAEYLRGKVPPS